MACSLHPKFDMRFFPSLLFTLICIAGLSQDKGQNQNIRVVIGNVRDAEGTLWVALFNSEENFLNERFRSLKLTPNKGQVVGEFEDIPPGNYAISVLHDTNNNKIVDKNAFGMPTEGVGFSNNAMGRFGPPDYKNVVFEFPKESEIVINLKYMTGK